jgi:hypothetical protein
VPPPHPHPSHQSFPPSLPRAWGHSSGLQKSLPATHLPRTGLGPTLGETKGTGAGAPQKQAAPSPPNPWRVWEKFQAALQRAAGGLAAKSTAGLRGRPRGVKAGVRSRRRAGTFAFFAVAKLPRGRKRLPRRRPVAAAALHARPRLLLLLKSYFALGGKGAEPGVTSPRGLQALLRNAGSGAPPERRALPRPRALRSLPAPGAPPLFATRAPQRLPGS